MKINDLKRPMSSKPSNTRPTTGKPSVIKTEDTQVETLTNKNKNTIQNNTEDEKISESLEDNISNSKINNKSRSTIDKLDFLDSLAKGSRRDSFINLLDEEAQRIDKINDKKQKLNFITLKENDIEGLYEWKTLFNHSRPLSHYTRINYKKPILTEETDINDIKSPKVLVDLPDDKMLLFFGKNAFENDNDNKKKKKSSSFRKKANLNYNISNTASNDGTQTLKSNRSKFRASSKMKTSRTKVTGKKENNKTEKGHNYIKPMSLYANFNPEDTFYFSNTFSDYYKEDLKSFTKKMPILKAKIKTNSKRLKRIINKQRIKSSLKEQQLYDLLVKDSLALKKQDLIISAERKNPVPLMKSIYHQENPDAQEIKEHIRKYFNTMKPLGNDDGKTDFTKNDRWRLNRELIKFRKGKFNEENKNDYGVGKKRRLILSYYNINDPDIQIFTNLNTNENRMDHSFEFKNDNYNVFNEKYRSKSTEIIEEIEKDNENNNNNTDKENKVINIKKEEKKENTINSSLKQRPRTGFKHSRGLNILNNEILKQYSNKLRPHSSNLRRNNFLTENIFDIKDYNELYKDYMPSNRFPLKTSSKVVNSSYNKMNKMIKEKHLMKKYSKDYFMTQPGNMHLETYFNDNYEKKRRVRPGTAGGERGRNRMKANLGINSENSNSNINKNKQKCNYFLFNQYINIDHDLDLPSKTSQFKGYFSPMNCFNKLAGKYYSSSNNVHVKNKRNKKKEILNNYYGSFGNALGKSLKKKLYF